MTDTSPPSNSLWTRLIADAHRAVRAVVDVRRQIGVAVVLSVSAGALWVGGVEARAAMRRLFERSSDQAAQVSPSTVSSQRGGGTSNSPSSTPPAAPTLVSASRKVRAWRR